MDPTVFLSFLTSDADRTIALHEAFGFTERALYRNDDDSSVVDHAGREVGVRDHDGNLR